MKPAIYMILKNGFEEWSFARAGVDPPELTTRA
jgi:hypothetical protein